MQTLRPGFDLDAFFDRVAAAPARALLLDYDGTLAPFRRERDRAFPYPGIRERLDAIVDDDRTRVGIVSGRPLADLAPLLSLSKPPELWGSHGLERLGPSGGPGGSPAPPGLVRFVERVGRWAAEEGWAESFEHKPYGFALHGRGLDARRLAHMRAETVGLWGDEARSLDLELLDFEGGFEFRPSGSHKGDVIRSMLAELPAGSALAYLGDDRTDEDAFTALAGKGTGVLVRPALRPTAADLWIAPPGELLEFLTRWRDAARGRAPGAAGPPPDGRRESRVGPNGN
jgi:trehalose-phosphatase